MIPQNPPSSTRACPTLSSRATSYSSQIPNPTSNCPMYLPGCRISPNGGLLPAASRAFYPISVPSILGFPHQCPFLFADTQEPPTSTWPPLSHSHLSLLRRLRRPLSLHTPLGGPGAPLRRRRVVRGLRPRRCRPFRTRDGPSGLGAQGFTGPRS